MPNSGRVLVLLFVTHPLRRSSAMKICLSCALLLLPLLPTARSQETPAAAAPAVVKADMQSLTPGPLPDEMMVVDGEFEILVDGSNKVLQMKPEPLTEGTVLFGKSLKNGGTVKARIKGTSKKRSHPKFGIGIGGTSGYRIRIVGAEKLMEICKEEERKAEAAVEWKSDVWTWLELSVVPAADGKWQIEGRMWAEGAVRPEKATVSLTTEVAPPNGKASVLGAPYSGLPIHFDDVEITPNPEKK
jgi:hypothetical protein